MRRATLRNVCWHLYPLEVFIIGPAPLGARAQALQSESGRADPRRRAGALLCTQGPAIIQGLISGGTQGFVMFFFSLLFTYYLFPEITLEYALGEHEIHDSSCYGNKREVVSESNFEPSLFIKK